MSIDLTSLIADLARFSRAQLDQDEDNTHLPDRQTTYLYRYIAAKRHLISEILREPHEYIPGDAWYSCSLAIDPDSDDQEPGSGCLDSDRSGTTCDCGRDARVERLLRIIAATWAERPGYPPEHR